MQPLSARPGVFDLISLWIPHCVRNDRSVGATWPFDTLMHCISYSRQVGRPFGLICHCEKAEGFRGNLLNPPIARPFVFNQAELVFRSGQTRGNLLYTPTAR